MLEMMLSGVVGHEVSYLCGCYSRSPLAIIIMILSWITQINQVNLQKVYKLAIAANNYPS